MAEDESAQPGLDAQEPATFAEALFGPRYEQDSLMQRFLRLPLTARVAGGVAFLAAVLFVPFLGAVGLWDPWEPHYGEVAREMIYRSDWVYPFWENGWLFSKPALTMWLMALGMSLVGTTSADAGPAPEVVSSATEWGMRLPFVLLSIAAVALLALAVSRVVSKRAGVATGFILMTMPTWFLITRQAVTDVPFVASFVAAMACALIGQLDPSTRHRSAWWYAFYVFAAVGTLAKGLLGIGFPAVILLGYAVLGVLPWTSEAWKKHWDWAREHALWPVVQGLGAAVVVTAVSYLWMRGAYAGTGVERDQLLVRKVFAGLLGLVAFSGVVAVQVGRRAPDRGPVPALWAQLFNMRLGTGIVVFFALTLPWYLTLTLFEEVGNAEEGQLFWIRFFVHDHFNRLASGVHTTTPGGAFTYFIEQGGYAIFPWVALVPGAGVIIGRLRARGGSRADHVALIATVWLALTFGLLTMSETRFHHYVFPILPALAILMGLFVDRVWEEGLARHVGVTILGLVLLMVVGHDLASNPKHFTDLFVYNYSRAYPVDLVTRPVGFLGRNLAWGDLFGLVLLAGGAYLVWDALVDKAKSLGGKALGLMMVGGGLSIVIALSMKGKVSLALLWGVCALAVAGYIAWETRKERSQGWPQAGIVALAGVALVVRGLRVAAAADPFYTRLVDPVNVKTVLGFSFGVVIVLLAVAAARRAKAMAFGVFGAFALIFALWFNWGHWVQLSHHWTQRDLFWKYYELRQPNEPIAAYLMNWRGETFYSQNRVKQFPITDHVQRVQLYANQPGREWALVEHHRLQMLQNAVGAVGHTATPVTTEELNNKFVLVHID